MIAEATNEAEANLNRYISVYKELEVQKKDFLESLSAIKYQRKKNFLPYYNLCMFQSYSWKQTYQYHAYSVA